MLTITKSAYDLYARVAAVMPDNSGSQRDLSVAANKMGDLEFELGDIAAATAGYQAAFAIINRLSRADPENTGLQRDVAANDGRLASVPSRQGAREAASSTGHHGAAEAGLA